jgi:hypothetical protein
MAYDEYEDSRDRIPGPPPRRSVDEETLAAQYDQRRRLPGQPNGWGCSKGCLYGMAGFGCLTVLVIVITGFLAANFFRRAISTDPVAVTETAREMADFDLPPDLKPAAKIDLWFIKSVEFVSDDGESVLSIGQLDTKKLPGGNAQKIDFEQGPHGNRHLEVVKFEQREMKIRGANSKVTFAEAKDPSTGQEYHKVSAKFTGKAGPAEFELQIPKEKYKEADVKKFIDSIK